MKELIWNRTFILIAPSTFIQLFLMPLWFISDRGGAQMLSLISSSLLIPIVIAATGYHLASKHEGEKILPLIRSMIASFLICLCIYALSSKLSDFPNSPPDGEGMALLLFITIFGFLIIFTPIFLLLALRDGRR